MIINLKTRRKQQANEKVVQLLQHDNMHKFKYYMTLPNKMVQILQDDNMHKYFTYYNTVAQTVRSLHSFSPGLTDSCEKL
jgi:hypothetical protein